MCPKIFKMQLPSFWPSYAAACKRISSVFGNAPYNTSNTYKIDWFNFDWKLMFDFLNRLEWITQNWLTKYELLNEIYLYNIDTL